MRIKSKSIGLLLSISIILATDTSSVADVLNDIFPSPDRSGVLAIETILPQIHDRVPGAITGVMLERKYNQWIYVVDIMASDERRVEIKMDAITGNIISQKNKVRKLWE
jgi:uncharacterized membrane protein YkoI